MSTIVDSAIEMRDKAVEERVKEILNNKSIFNEAILAAARSHVSRTAYKQIANVLGTEIVWGEGGGQTRKELRLARQGVSFIRVPAMNYSKERDLIKLIDKRF